MPTTIIAKPASAIETVTGPVIDVRRQWSDAWEPAPELLFLSGQVNAASDDLSRIEFERRYGRVKSLADSSIVDRGPRDLLRHWVRLRMVDGSANVTEFVGRVEGINRTIGGDDAGAGGKTSGRQRYVAYGPLQILRKTAVTDSYWQASASTVNRLGWIPNFNAADEFGLSTGNRSDFQVADAAGSYAFGGRAKWSRLDILEYVVKRYVVRSDGVAWSIAGQVELLDSIRDEVHTADTQSAAELVDRVIPREYGLDWQILPTAAGFEIRVFCLNASPYEFGSARLPVNPWTVVIDASTLRYGERVEAVDSAEQEYDRIRIVGGRIVVVDNLYLSVAGFTRNATRGWSAKLETDYIELDAGDAAATDAARRADAFRSVYRHLQALATYDHRAGAASPQTDRRGLLLRNYDTGAVVAAPYQNLIQSTLPWLPLRDGINYCGGAFAWVLSYDDNGGAGPVTISVQRESGQPGLQTVFVESDLVDVHWATGVRFGCTVNSVGTEQAEFAGGGGDAFPPFYTPLYVAKSIQELPATVVPQFVPPAAFIWDEENLRYAAADELGIGVSALRTALGVQLGASPNHLLGLNHFDAIAGGDTSTDPIYDYDKSLLTIAYETDSRLTLTHGFPAGAGLTGATLDIVDDSAELWFLAPSVIVGVDENGNARVGPSAGLVLRNDAERLELRMAGAIARYWYPRRRKELILRGFRPWGHLVGQLLDVLEHGASKTVPSPISSVTWVADPSPRTIIRTGNAT